MYRVFSEFLYTFVFAAIFSTFFLSSNDRKQKSVVDKDETKKVKLWPIFEPFLGDQNGHPELDPLDVLVKVGAGKGQRGKDRNKQREKPRKSSQLNQKARKSWAELPHVYS